MCANLHLQLDNIKHKLELTTVTSVTEQSIMTHLLRVQDILDKQTHSNTAKRMPRLRFSPRLTSKRMIKKKTSQPLGILKNTTLTHRETHNQ